MNWLKRDNERHGFIKVPERARGWPMSGNYYLDWFLGLKCAGDVLNAVSPIGKEPAKEITEAVAVVRAVRRLLLAETGGDFGGMSKWELLDLCSGNALVPVIAAHLFPLAWCWATDVKPRKRPWGAVKRFTWHTAKVDVREDFSLTIVLPTSGDRFIVTAVHPCGDLAFHVVKRFLDDQLCRHLVLMPCCQDSASRGRSYGFLDGRLDAYERMCLALCDVLVDGGCVNVRAERDAHVLSPCNVVITASKAAEGKLSIVAESGAEYVSSQVSGKVAVPEWIRPALELPAYPVPER